MLSNKQQSPSPRIGEGRGMRGAVSLSVFMNNLNRLPLTTALHTLRANIGRSALTVIGITLGIAMVIIVFSAGAGMKALVLGQIASFGDNWIHVEVKIPSTKHFSQENTSGQARGVTITTLTAADAKAVRRLSNISDIYTVITSQATVTYANQKERPIIFGVDASYDWVDPGRVEFGRFFTDSENSGAAQVAVLGSAVKEDLFGNADAVGEKIRVSGKTYEVVGVEAERGVTGFFNIDEVLFLPVKTVQKKILNVNHVLMMLAQGKKSDELETTAEEIRQLLRERHGITDPDKDDFAVNTQKESQAIVSTIFLGITWLLVGLAAISLLVGGIGILNVMYTSVAERTYEIGLRKAVGATSRAILAQFLTEAVVTTLAGGLAGILIGVIIAYAVAFGARSFGLDWPFHISIFSILLSFGFSAAIGLGFGVYPAKQAAALPPMVAIREEG